MVRVLRFIPAVATLLIAVLLTPVAFAAPAPWQSVDVTLHSEQSGSVLLVSGELPSTATLPAEVELSVPAGSEIGWIGEILGGPTTEDPDVKYVKSASGGTDVYRFTLTKSRVAQIEVAVPGVDSFDGSTYGTTLKWVASQDVPSVRISARVKMGAKIVDASPGATMMPGESGYTYYSKSVPDVKAGAPVELAFTYMLPATGQSGSTAAASGGQETLVLVVVLALLGAVAVGIGVRRKLARKRAAAEAIEPNAKPKAPRGATDAADIEAEDVLEDAAEPDRTGRLRKRYLVMGITAVGVAVVVFALANQPTPSQFIDGKLKKSFGAPTACTSVSIPLTPEEGVDLAVSGGKLMDALEGLPSLGDVTIYLDPPSIDVGFCESSLTEEAVREALASAGIVTLGANSPQSAQPETATVAP